MENFELRINKLVLHNFRQFDSIEISFDEKLTVIIAENGGGKTTILDSLSGMMAYLIQQIKQISRQKEPFVKDDIRWKQRNFENKLTFNHTLAPLSVEFERRENQSAVSAFYLENESDVFYELNQKARLGEINLPIIAYYPCYLADYPLSNGQGEVKELMYSEPFDAYEHALDAYVLDFKVLKKWLIWKFHQEVENGDKVFNYIREALVGEKGMLNDDTQRRFTDLKVTYQESPNGNFVFLKDKIMLFENQLSSGERSLMTLVADIARRLVIANPLSKNPLLEGSGLILIDEIDLHLHPLWQRKVVLKLMEIFPNVQFVVTTHSAEVLKGLDRKHLRIIKNGQLLSFAPYIKERDTNSILADAFDVSEHSPEYEEKIKEMYRLIETNKIAARKILDELKTEWGEMDDEIIRAESYFEIF